ncbi:MAG TPA: response regulator transcription factor [Chloroflexota bacterium]|jgi:DNA-binding NarL/FixJ family response regulator
MPDRIRVLLVDSPTLLRKCLATLLGRKRHLEIVGDAGTGPDALAQARALSPDVVLVDPSVPEAGPALVADLCSQTPALAVVILTAEAKQGTVARLLHHGARGYLEKDCDVEAVAQCIERVYAGEVVIGSPSPEALTQDLAAFRDADQASLTGREVEVMRLAAVGRTNREIGLQLCITEHTVKSHLARILGKLGLDNRVQLSIYANQKGIVS